MTSERSHCDYSGLRCITVLKALKPKVQKEPFCIPYSLFFHLSSQSPFFPLNKQQSDTLDASLNTNADKVVVFNSQGQKGIESVNSSHYHRHIKNLPQTHKCARRNKHTCRLHTPAQGQRKRGAQTTIREAFCDGC